VLMTLTSVSLKEYCLKKGDNNCEEVNLTVPFSLRPLPDSPSELIMANDFAPLPIKLVVRNDFESTMEIVSKDMKKLRTSFQPYGMYYFLWILLQLPTIGAYFGLDDLANELTMVYSNVAGPKVPIKFNGQSSHKLFFYVPAVGKLAVGLSIISHGDVLKLGFSSDESYCDDPQELIDIFERNFKKYVVDFELASV